MRNTSTSYFFITFFLLIGIGQHVHAQDVLQRMAVTPTEAPARSIVVMQDYPDHAVLVFSSPITGLTFDSNMAGIVQQRNEPGSGRYILVIEPWTQIIIIDAPGYMQQRLRVGSPEPRQTLYYDIEPEQRAAELISVIFNVEPDDAALFVDGQETEINQTVQLAPGSAEVRIERDGFRARQDIIDISGQNISFTYLLEEIDIVPVRIASNIEGARITIDGTERGEIDRSGILGLFLYPGTYALTVSSSGYVTETTNIEVSEAGENRFTINLQGNIGELALEITPSDARVELNRQNFTDQRLLELAPGRYRLDVQKDGYAPYSETVEIERNERLERSINLEAYTGSLQFSVSPGNAMVTLLDASGVTVESWQGINLLRNLNVGTYTLQVKANGHLPAEETVTISRDERLEQNVLLNEGTPWERETETRVVNVTNPSTGRTWMDRNLGASRAATSSTDSEAYGDLFQWGRAADGHQNRNSSTISTQSSSDQPGHGDFILAPDNPYDWRSPQNDDLWQGGDGINNPCPDGYRLPTEAEWEAERESWSSNNASGAFNSPLKLPLAGYRSYSSGSLVGVGSYGIYWSGSVSGSKALGLGFNSGGGLMDSSSRARGFSMRCLED